MDPVVWIMFRLSSLARLDDALAERAHLLTSLCEKLAVQQRTSAGSDLISLGAPTSVVLVREFGEQPREQFSPGILERLDARIEGLGLRDRI